MSDIGGSLNSIPMRREEGKRKSQTQFTGLNLLLLLKLSEMMSCDFLL
jgi:hypothetical protein